MELICMLLIFLLNIIALVTTITIFADLDGIKYMPANALNVSEKINKFFNIELGINICTTIFSFMNGSLIVFFISLVLTFYNVKLFLNKEYKLYFAIGEDNKTTYEKLSLKYKFKFMVYLIIVVFSLGVLIIYLFMKFLETFLNNKSVPTKILSWLRYI